MSLMLLTAFLTVTMFPGIVSAASEKRKLVASETTYFADGKKKNAISYKYDKYGNIIRKNPLFLTVISVKLLKPEKIPTGKIQVS